MAVNISIYGNETDWLPFFSAGKSWNEKAIPKLAAFKNDAGKFSSYLKDAVSSGVLTLNQELDKSISFSAVDDGSWLCNQSWYYVNTTSLIEPASAIDEVCKLQKHSVNPLSFFIKGGYGSSQEMPYCNSTNYTKQFYGFNQFYNVNNCNLNLRPVTYISVKDMVYVIMVRAINKNPETVGFSDDIATANYDLYTYMKYTDSDGKHIYNDYPWVICLYLLPLYSNLEPVTGKIYRSLTNNGSISSIQPAIMNSFETGISPFNEEETPLKILSYYQIIGQSGNDGGFKAALPFTNPTRVPSSYTVSYRPVVIAGSRNFWQTPVKKNMYLLSSECKSRHFLDGNNIRWGRWIEKVDESNSNVVYEKYMKQAAYFGSFFTDSYDYAVHAPAWDIEHTFIGTLDDNGVAHGEYTEGTENRKQKQWDWNDWSDTPYNPFEKPESTDKEQESDPFIFSGGNLHGLASGRYYAITAKELNDLQNWISKVVNPSGEFYNPSIVQPPADLYDPESLAYAIERMFSGVYPNDCIINLMYYPFDIFNALGLTVGIPEAIKLGNTTTSTLSNWYGNTTIEGASAIPLQNYGSSQYAVINTPEYNIEEYFGDFRDYQPYTTIELLIPWHGTVALDPSHWYGHSLSTKMVVDIITGTSTTYILRDGIPINSVDGQVGYTINFSIRNIGDFSKSAIESSQALNNQRFDNARTSINALTGITSGVVAGASGVATGDIGAGARGITNTVGAVLNGVVNIEQGKRKYNNLQFSLTHCPSGSTMVSSQSPSVSQYANTDLRLIIKRPHLIAGYNQSVYGATVGFACNMQGSIGSFSGFTVFSGAELNGLNATEKEKEMIYSALQSGIII